LDDYLFPKAAGFLEAFEPWYVKYAWARLPDKAFLAGAVGYGCFLGIGKTARISKWINATALETTVNGYFTLENLQAANDLILKCMDQRELPEVYRRQASRLHTVSDGQKYGVAVESLNANYYFKYLGQDAGVSVDTFTEEPHFLWHHDVISASECEAAYVIDGLMHNDVIKSDIHSTDTHGYSEMTCGALYLLGFLSPHGSRPSSISNSTASASCVSTSSRAMSCCPMGTSKRRSAKPSGTRYCASMPPSS
jgi:hypothetical protein